MAVYVSAYILLVYDVEDCLAPRVNIENADVEHTIGGVVCHQNGPRVDDFCESAKIVVDGLFRLFMNPTHERQAVLVANKIPTASVVSAPVQGRDPIRLWIECNQIVVSHDVVDGARSILKDPANGLRVLALRILNNVEAIWTAEQVPRKHYQIGVARFADKPLVYGVVAVHV